MRGAALALSALIVGLALAGCEREPSFEDRYDSAQQTIEAKAQELDAQIAREEAAQSEIESDAEADEAAVQPEDARD